VEVEVAAAAAGVGVQIGQGSLAEVVAEVAAAEEAEGVVVVHHPQPQMV
jgi:hypothetical protein